MSTKIYTIMVFSEIKENKYGLPDIKCERVVGFYVDKNKAFQAVKENWADIHEYTYDYALIEEVSEGLYDAPSTRWFFKFNKDLEQYEEIPEPILFNHLCGLTMG